jgi:UDP-3-O-acyl-N-acetylglucosamine deacetylase
MMQQRIRTWRLCEPVTLTGRDFWGRKTGIHLAPSRESGYYWRYSKHMQAEPIDWQLAYRSRRRITLHVGRARFEAYEHWGVLRWLGLDNVVFEINGWPPYDTVDAFWKQIKPCCEAVDDDQPWFTIASNLRAGRRRGDGFTEVVPRGDSGLAVRIQCVYRGIGAKTSDFNIPSDALAEAIEAGTQGWPRWCYYPSRVASSLCWPTHQKIVWLQEYGVATRELFVKHRLVDLLGALSLFRYQGLLAARVHSYCGGHETDITCLKQIASTHLIRL